MDTKFEFVRDFLKAGHPKIPEANISDLTTPVVYFGQYISAKAATVGINPSDREFFEKDQTLFKHDSKRLTDAEKLGKSFCAGLSDHEIQKIISGCDNYYKSMNAYMTWFNPLQQVAQYSIKSSYVDGSLCHIDLLPWATSTKWGKLQKTTKEELLEAGRPFFEGLVKNSGFQYLFLNGRSVIDAFCKTIEPLNEIDRVSFLSVEGNKTNRSYGLWKSNWNGKTVVGWSVNLQSSHGVSKPMILDLGQRLKKVLNT